MHSGEYSGAVHKDSITLPFYGFIPPSKFTCIYDGSLSYIMLFYAWFPKCCNNIIFIFSDDIPHCVVCTLQYTVCTLYTVKWTYTVYIVYTLHTVKLSDLVETYRLF